MTIAFSQVDRFLPEASKPDLSCDLKRLGNPPGMGHPRIRHGVEIVESSEPEKPRFFHQHEPGALPLGYGRYLGAQLVARALEQSYGVPVYNPSQATQHQREMLAHWAAEGYGQCAPIEVVGACTAPVEVIGPRSALARRDERDGSELVERPLDGSAFEFDERDQRRDPLLSRALVEISHEASHWRENHVVKSGTLWFCGKDELGDMQLRKCVPKHLQRELMSHFHYGLISGHRNSTLYPALKKYYHWDGMKADCEAFASNCRHCAERAIKADPQRRALGETPIGRAPFQQINIDLKGPLRQSGGFSYILVVVDSFTRYTLYIPLPDKRAETIFRALLNDVFCHYGMPFGMTIVSDNGTEFENELQAEMSRYLGYRKIAVAPWNPQANGLAEAAVKRVKVLLDRHTKHHRDWHKLLPLAQYLLNTSFHHGVGVAPFTALFGRVAPQIPELEDPELRRIPEGNTFAKGLSDKLKVLHDQIRDTSDQIRLARRVKSQQHVKTHAYAIEVGDTVWMLYQNKEAAARIRKSGHGDPWRHRYRVVAINDFTAKLTALDGAPEVSSWQPLHKITKSPPQLVEDEYGVIVDGSGRTMAPGCRPLALEYAPTHNPLANPEFVGQPPDDDGNYEVQDVIGAIKRGKHWYVKVKWQGWAEPTEERRVDILDGCGSDVKQMVRKACAAAHLNNRAYQIDEQEGDDSDGEGEDANPPEQVERALAASFALLSQPLTEDDVQSLSCLLPLRHLHALGTETEQLASVDVADVRAETDEQMERALTRRSPEADELKDRALLRRIRRQLQLTYADGTRNPDAYALAVRYAAEGDATLACCLAGPETLSKARLNRVTELHSDAVESQRRWERISLESRLKLMRVPDQDAHAYLALMG